MQAKLYRDTKSRVLRSVNFVNLDLTQVSDKTVSAGVGAGVHSADCVAVKSAE
jgi:hypothetical protein